jgi:hypothetical protein
MSTSRNGDGPLPGERAFGADPDGDELEGRSISLGRQDTPAVRVMSHWIREWERLTVMSPRLRETRHIDPGAFGAWLKRQFFDPGAIHPRDEAFVQGLITGFLTKLVKNNPRYSGEAWKPFTREWGQYVPQAQRTRQAPPEKPVRSPTAAPGASKRPSAVPHQPPEGLGRHRRLTELEFMGMSKWGSSIIDGASVDEIEPSVLDDLGPPGPVTPDMLMTLDDLNDLVADRGGPVTYRTWLVASAKPRDVFDRHLRSLVAAGKVACVGHRWKVESP